MDRESIESVNSTGLLNFILEDAIENVRKWGIHFAALPDAAECIRLSGILLITRAKRRPTR